MLVAKPESLPKSSTRVFENYVNYAGSKTNLACDILDIPFENYVNYAGSKTMVKAGATVMKFENYVNYFIIKPS